MEAVKVVGSIELFIVFTVAAFNLTVVTRRVRLDKFVSDTETLKLQFKECWFVAFQHQTVGEFSTVVCLDALDDKGEFLHYMA